jgi:hypothetical protein
MHTRLVALAAAAPLLLGPVSTACTTAAVTTRSAPVSSRSAPVSWHAAPAASMTAAFRL